MVSLNLFLIKKSFLCIFSHVCTWDLSRLNTVRMKAKVWSECFHPTCRWMKTTDPKSLHVPPCRSTCSMRRICRKRMPLQETKNPTMSVIILWSEGEKKTSKAHVNPYSTWWLMWQTLGRLSRHQGQWWKRWPLLNLLGGKKDTKCNGN